jgi:hypothetical protein
MRDTYAQAAKVLVLDKTLYSAPADISIHEKYMRVAVSTWSSRLWTLQEVCDNSPSYDFLHTKPIGQSILSKATFYQFADGPVQDEQLDKEALHLDSNADLSLNEKATMRMILPTLRIGMMMMHRSQRSPSFFSSRAEERLEQVHLALSMRLTSKAEDEAVCIATLIGIDPSSVIRAPSSERMRVLFRSLEAVPVGLLFVLRPRYKETEDRWIPKTLLWNPFHTRQREDFHNGSAIVTLQGLSITVPGYRFQHCITTVPGTDVLVFKVGDLTFVAFFLYADDTVDKVSWAKYSQEDVAIVFPEAPSVVEPHFNGCLVRIESQNADGDGVRIRAVWEANVGGQSRDMYYQPLEFPSHVPVVQPSEILSQDQKWNIG